MALLHAPVSLSPLFVLSACSVCLGRTVELPLDTPSTQHLGRHPANTHLPSPNRNTPPPTPIGPFALQGNTTADPQQSYLSLALLRAVSTSHNNAHQHALAGEERHAPVCFGDTAATLLPTPIHPVRPVWSGASPTPDKRGWNHHILDLSRCAPTTTDPLFTLYPDHFLRLPPPPPPKPLMAPQREGIEKRGRPPRNRRALCRAKFISQNQNVVLALSVRSFLITVDPLPSTGHLQLSLPKNLKNHANCALADCS